MIAVTETSPGSYQLDWRAVFADQPVSIYSSCDPDGDDWQIIDENASETGQYSGFDADKRYFFRIENQPGEQCLAAQRDVPLEGAVNFRDLGGYPTILKSHTRWGRIYRSGHMARLTVNDHKYLENIGIRTICDFRREIEIQNEGSSLPTPGTTYNVQIVPGARDPNHIQHLFAGTQEPQDVLEAMIEIMRILIAEAAPQYKRLFELLLAHENGAFLMNCSAGKERTGVGSALVLMALGVPREQIKYDFMLSGKYFPIQSEIPRVIEKYSVELPGEAGVRLVMPLLEAHEAYIDAVFDEIDKNFTSDEAFIRETYSLGDNELKLLRAKFTTV